MNYYNPKMDKLCSPYDLRRMGLNPDRPDILNRAGFFPVRYESPQIDHIRQKLKISDVITKDPVKDEYIVKYEVFDLPQEMIEENLKIQQEELFRSLREERDKRLDATDYLVSPDYPISDEKREQVYAYRKALRDLPEQEGAPWDGGGHQTPWPKMNEMNL